MMRRMAKRRRLSLYLVLLLGSVVLASAAHAKERPGAAPMTGQGPDDVLQKLDRPAQQAAPPLPQGPPPPPPPPVNEDALETSWRKWAPLFSPRLRGMRATKAGTDMPSIQKA